MKMKVADSTGFYFLYQKEKKKSSVNMTHNGIELTIPIIRAQCLENCSIAKVVNFPSPLLLSSCAGTVGTRIYSMYKTDNLFSQLVIL